MGIYLNGISKFKFNIKRDLKILINKLKKYMVKKRNICYYKIGGCRMSDISVN